MKDVFVLPERPLFLEALTDNELKVVVISIIGKSAYSSFGLKVKPLGKVFEFHKETKAECVIEGSYDDERQIIYLHLSSLLDTDSFIEHYIELSERCKEQNKNTDFLTIYNEVKSSSARAFLLLFHISHIVILSHPGHSLDFDINYIQIFKSLDSIRQKCFKQITEVLRSIPKLNPEWIENGRPCTPRLVFYFERCPKQYRKRNQYSHQNFKKLEHDIEDRIYHIFRKVRIVGSTNCNSLFAIPANQEYVYVNDSAVSTIDRLATAVENVVKSCHPGNNEAVPFPFSYQSEMSVAERTFHQFLRVHTDLAFSKGFDDNVGTGRHASNATAYFEVPFIDQWFDVAVALYKFFMSTPSTSNEDEAILHPHMLSSLYTDTKFSEQRCQKVLPLALARYQENLPNHYTKSHHETRLAMAAGVFAVQARGPMFEKYSEQLIEKCNKHFENGHQLCEYPSLTGNPCTNPKHDSDVEHCSGVKYVASCDCGRKQGSRDDPYSIRQANYNFYQSLAIDCVCGKPQVERVKFPVFQPSTEEYRAANLFAGGVSVTTTSKAAKSQEQVSSDKMSVSRSDLSQDDDLLSPSKSDFSLPHPQENVSPQDNEIVLEILEEKDETKDKNLVRQPSTTEYLPGMLTTTSPSSLLPQFPSWSLVCLGASSLYSHNLGLSDNQHPGFLTGTNFLLPWDVTVRLEHSKPNWPAVNDTKKFQSNMMRSRRTRSGNSMSHFVVKIFVGVEYECPRGHRFMLSSPDKVLRAASGIVKETGHKITNSDMPLYYNCPCRLNKPLVAQLMRIHVVSPKAPVYVTLNPKVQPAPGAPIFVPKVDGPVHISQSAYWVLRLPYVFATDRETYVANRQSAETGPKLLSGMWGVAESSEIQ